MRCKASNPEAALLHLQELLSLRVFGRLPGTDAMRDSEAGVRKASKEETAGEFAPAVVSGYGDLAPAFDLIFRSRIGAGFRRAL